MPRPNTIRLVSYTDPGYLSADNPLGIDPDVKRLGWESYRAKSIVAGVPSLDETIAAGYGFCDGWAVGQWPLGKQPPAVREIISGAKFGSTPRSILDFDALEKWAPGFIPATRKRTDACRAKGLKAIWYGGALPLNVFSKLTAAQREALLNKLTKIITDCGYTTVGIDMFAGDSQKYGKSPTMRWAENLLAAGVEVCMNAQARFHPELFELINGRFGVIAEPNQWNDAKDRASVRPDNSIGCIRGTYLWLQGSDPVRFTWADEFSARADLNGGAALVNFGDSQWWKVNS